MATEYNVLAPGPVNLHPKVREALALPMIHHRTPEFDQILSRVLKNLKLVFKTEQPVFILTSTGSGGMEALLVNVLKPGDKVLAIDSGKFGERWAEMAQAYGGELISLKVPWGQSVAVEQVREILEREPQTKVVLCQACETSTGALHPIKELGELIAKYPQTLFLVDGITALGALPLEMDAWHIDGLVGGSQKAFMLPTGLALISFSAKAWQVINGNSQPRYYFDVRRELKANQKGETFFSSNVTLIRALDVVLNLILSQGFPALFKEIEGRAQFTRHFAKTLGFELYSETPSPSVTALKVPAGVDSQALRTQLEEKYKITIMGGQDQAKGKIIRIGHMGFIKPLQMIELMSCLAKILDDMNPKLEAQTKFASQEAQMKAWLGIA